MMWRTVLDTRDGTVDIECWTEGETPPTLGTGCVVLYEGVDFLAAWETLERNIEHGRRNSRKG